MKSRFILTGRKRPFASSITCFGLFLVITYCCLLFFPSFIEAQGYLPPEQIILTWTGDPGTTQTITWLLPQCSPAGVQYLRAEDYDQGENFDNAHQLTIEGIAFDIDNTFYSYTANLTGLDPDTKYVYRVGNEGAWSKPTTFSTAAETENFSFLYMGDIQSGYEAWGEMLNSVYEENPEIKFALLGGDLTDSSHDVEEWEEFLDAASGVFSRIPVMPTLGNHDGESYLGFFALPDNGPAGLEQEFYSFDYGSAHFVVLNSNKNALPEIKQWLQRDLEATNKKWKFALFHHPAYPAVYDYKGIDKSICQNWVPVLEENGVDMVFVGHQHLYMRTHPIFQTEVQTDADGIVYVLGNAGSKTYAGGGGFSYIACEKTGSNYQLIELDGDLLTLTSRETNGELIETYFINKSDRPQPQKPLYEIVPLTGDTYTIGKTTDGIKNMTVNEGQTGWKYFAVSVEPLEFAKSKATVIFAHLRDGFQLGLSVLKAGFATVETVQAGFDIKGGDVIKVYIVDDLNNAADHNPIILQ